MSLPIPQQSYPTTAYIVHLLQTKGEQAVVEYPWRYASIRLDITSPTNPDEDQKRESLRHAKGLILRPELLGGWHVFAGAHSRFQGAPQLLIALTSWLPQWRERFNTANAVGYQTQDIKYTMFLEEVATSVPIVDEAILDCIKTLQKEQKVATGPNPLGETPAVSSLSSSRVPANSQANPGTTNDKRPQQTSQKRPAEEPLENLAPKRPKVSPAKGLALFSKAPSDGSTIRMASRGHDSKPSPGQASESAAQGQTTPRTAKNLTDVAESLMLSVEAARRAVHSGSAGDGVLSPDDFIRLPIPLLLPHQLSPVNQEKISAVRNQYDANNRNWYSSHGCQGSSDSILEGTFDLHPTRNPHGLQVFAETMDPTNIDPLLLHKAITVYSTEYNHNLLQIERSSNVVYELWANVAFEDLPDFLHVLGNVRNKHRDRIHEAVVNLMITLWLNGAGPKTRVFMHYSGHSIFFSTRSHLDTITLNVELQNPQADRRTPIIQAIARAAKVTSVEQVAEVYWVNGMPEIEGYRGALVGDDGKSLRQDTHGNLVFPRVVRVAVADMEKIEESLQPHVEAALNATNPSKLNVQLGSRIYDMIPAETMELARKWIAETAFDKILFLSDARGIKGVPFHQSVSGTAQTYFCRKLARRPDLILDFADWHGDKAFMSNVIIVTIFEIDTIRGIIDIWRIVIVIYGRTVAEANAREHLFDEKDVLGGFKTPFFTVLLVSIKGLLRIVILSPHIGIINHIGHQEWVLQAFADDSFVIGRLGTIWKQVCAEGFKFEDQAEEIMRRYKDDEVIRPFTERLIWFGMPQLWAGDVAPQVQNLLDEGFHISAVYKEILIRNDRRFVYTVDVKRGQPIEAPNRFIIKKRSDEGKSANVWLRIRDPQDGLGPYLVRDFQFPASFRGSKDVECAARVHPSTLHLQVVTEDFKIHRGRDPDNEADRALAGKHGALGGSVCSIPRSRWISSKIYSPIALTNHIRLNGWWYPETEYERIDREARENFTRQGKSALIMNLIQDLDQDVVDREALRGSGAFLLPISSGITMRWLEKDGTFKVTHGTEENAQSYQIPDYDKITEDKDVLWYYPILQWSRVTKRPPYLVFGFALYGLDEDLSVKKCGEHFPTNCTSTFVNKRMSWYLVELFLRNNPPRILTELPSHTRVAIDEDTGEMVAV